MPAVYEENIIKRQITKPRPVFSSLGLVIPFQPSMWDEKSIQAVLNYAMEIVETKLKDRYSAECTDKVLARLEKLFAKLNFNTHRKSLAVIHTPDEEKVIYLDFPVKPVVFFSRSVSLLDLVSSIQREPDFYFLVLNGGRARLYEYYNKHLSKVYEQNHETNADHLYKNTFGVIELLNSKNEKPVFVTGSPHLVEGFCKSSSFPQIIFKKLYQAAAFSDEIIQPLATEIISQWSYWQSKFITGRILIAQKAGSLIYNIDAVLQALHRKADGLLLMDKRLKKQLYKSGAGNDIVNISKELINQIEHFLARGNRIEITETGLLKDLGGIVLLHDKKSGVTEELPFCRHYEFGGADNLY